MPFDGSAIARSYSAEFMHAARQRSRSLSSLQSAGGPVSPGAQPIELEPEYDAPTIPAPVGAVSRFDEEYDKQLRIKAPLSPRSRGRSLTGLSARRGNAFVSPPIAEEEAQQLAADSDSSHTAIEDRDLERGELNEEEPRLYVAPVTTPKADGPASRQTKETNTEKSAEKAEEQGKAPEKKTSGQQPQKQKSKKEQEKDPFLVTLEGREHLNPHTWNETYRWFLTGLAGLFVLNATFASSAPSQLIPSIIAYFGVSREVGTLTVALFVAGYCVGPLIWGPLSERYGRKIVFIVAFIPYVAFQVGAALSPNIGALLAFRFLGGCFAASPLTNSGGVIADLWDANKRGIALAIFSLAPFAGPAIAPIVAGALEVTNTDWRWIFWILTIFAGVCLVAIVFLLPETYVPYILHKEAKRLRKETGDDRWHSPSEHPDHKVSISETLHHTVLKPFIMLVQEPMLFALTLYLSFVYGIVYLLFSAVPLVFQQNHGWSSLTGGLAFLGLPIGGTIATLIYALYFNKQYMAKHRARKGKMVPPEERLKPLMVAAPAFAVAFFWLGWTAYPSINVASPLLAVGLIGLCILWMFLSIFNYLIDAYLVNAASALAANTVMRSAFGAGFPLFASQMYTKLGIPGASSLLGGLAIVFMPIPFVLYKYGKKIRHMSKNAMVID